MTKPRYLQSWIVLVSLVGAASVAVGACSKQEDSGSSTGTGSTGSGASANSTGTKASGVGSSASAGGKTSTVGASGGAVATTNNSTSTTTTTVGRGSVAACQGMVTTPDKIGSVDQLCTPESEQSEPIPADMVILMDRSISNSYAVNSDQAVAAAAGQTSRWDVLTAGMKAVVESKDMADVGASLTFFSYKGTTDPNVECNVTDYVNPVVAYDKLGVNGAQMVSEMDALSPAGKTPTVPAITGALSYAMQLRLADQSREKVVVMISDGYPTICDQKTAPDVTAIIDRAATDKNVPIRTFVVGIGSANSMTMAKLNLISYASAGKTGQPIVLDEAAGADAVATQLVGALKNISNDPLACEYTVRQTAGTVVDPDLVTVTFQPAVGSFQEIPRVQGLSGCDKSQYGGWYFDNPTAPTKVTMCPCTCSNFGAGTVSIVYNCKPKLTIG